MTFLRLLAVAAVLAAPIAAPVSAAAQARAVPDYGSVAPLSDAHEQPDPARTYKVVFDVAKGPSAPGKPSAGLDRVARFVNILSLGGVPAGQRKIVAVVHGGATQGVLSDEAYARRHEGARNPDAPLVAQLVAAGVDLRICGQSMAAAKIVPADLAPGVQVDLAALMTVIHKQGEGYVLVVN
ncbi:DsrE family protein [Phenylobacterium sp.]|uniref:DsrE family protein n=1 Tax=Phenylobacterium sp. TaxID=1871053 RepID=UPI00391A1F79